MPLFNSNKKQAATFKNDRINMLNWGIAYVNESTGKGKDVCTVRIMAKKVKTDDGNYDLPEFYLDEEGNQYTPEQAMVLLAKALLNGGAINCHIFENTDGMSGNARVNVKGLADEPKPATRQRAAKANAKRAFTEVVVEDEGEDDDEDGIPF